MGEDDFPNGRVTNNQLYRALDDLRELFRTELRGTTEQIRRVERKIDMKADAEAVLQLGRDVRRLQDAQLRAETRQDEEREQGGRRLSARERFFGGIAALSTAGYTALVLFDHFSHQHP